MLQLRLQQRKNQRKAYNRWKQSKYAKSLLEKKWKKQDGLCALCNEPMIRGIALTPDSMTVDHRIPLCQGGYNKEDNLQLVHKLCNERKSFTDVLGKTL